MLFGPMFFIAGGITVTIACLDKTFEVYGFHAIGNILKIALPLVGLVAGIHLGTGERYIFLKSAK